jgi:hypothetical protein
MIELIASFLLNQSFVKVEIKLNFKNDEKDICLNFSNMTYQHAAIYTPSSRAYFDLNHVSPVAKRGQIQSSSHKYVINHNRNITHNQTDISTR